MVQLPAGLKKTQAGWRVKPPRGALPSAGKPGISTARLQQEVTHGKPLRAVKKCANAMNVRQPQHINQPASPTRLPPCHAKQSNLGSVQTAANYDRHSPARAAKHARRKQARVEPHHHHRHHRPHLHCRRRRRHHQSPPTTSHHPRHMGAAHILQPSASNGGHQRAGKFCTTMASCSPGSPTTAGAVTGTSWRAAPITCCLTLTERLHQTKCMSTFPRTRETRLSGDAPSAASAARRCRVLRRATTQTKNTPQ